ncbi:MAG: Gfo/Idh/MocA family oxidoreductase [Victivallaceae bacterium]|nr:Gfo/Idh/MocA family oxidoreductase [Victivallaceae bacterium]
MTIKVAVIGCGNISQFHFSGLEKCGAEIKWVCDINREAAMPWADKFEARYSADYRDIIADPAVDAVFVTLLSRLHKEICFAAIDAGKAVICEKTLAESAEDAWEIVQYAEAKKTIFYTSYMKRFIPAVEKAKALLPELGTIISTHIRAYQCWGDLWSETPTEGFFYTPPGGMSLVRKNYGGGILVCGGSHILDLTLFLLGRPHRLYATLHEPEGSDYDLQAAALLETDNGIVHYEALAHPLTKIGFLRDGWDEKVEINGTNGRLEVYSSNWTDVETKASLLVHYDNRNGNSTEYRFAAESPFDRAVEFFCQQIEQGEQGSQSRLTGYEVDELIEHIKLSSKQKQAVEIQWKT